MAFLPGVLFMPKRRTAKPVRPANDTRDPTVLELIEMSGAEGIEVLLADPEAPPGPIQKKGWWRQLRAVLKLGKRLRE